MNTYNENSQDAELAEAIWRALYCSLYCSLIPSILRAPSIAKKITWTNPHFWLYIYGLWWIILKLLWWLWWYSVRHISHLLEFWALCRNCNHPQWFWSVHKIPSTCLCFQTLAHSHQPNFFYISVLKNQRFKEGGYFKNIHVRKLLPESFVNFILIFIQFQFCRIGCQ